MWDAPVYAPPSGIRPAQVWPGTSESEEWTGPAIFSRPLGRTLPGLAGRSDICAPVHSAPLSPEKRGPLQSLGANSTTVSNKLASIDTSVIAKARQLEQLPPIDPCRVQRQTDDIREPLMPLSPSTIIRQSADIRNAQNQPFCAHTTLWEKICETTKQRHHNYLHTLLLAIRKYYKAKHLSSLTFHGMLK